MEMNSCRPRDHELPISRLPIFDSPATSRQDNRNTTQLLEARLGSRGFDLSANCLPACLAKLVPVAGLLQSQAKCNDKALEFVQECRGTLTSVYLPGASNTFLAES